MTITPGYFSKEQQENIDHALDVIKDAVQLGAPESKQLAPFAEYEAGALEGRHLCNAFNRPAGVPKDRRIEIDIQRREAAAQRITTEYGPAAESILSGNHSGPKTQTKFGDFDFKF